MGVVYLATLVRGGNVGVAYLRENNSWGNGSAIFARNVNTCGESGRGPISATLMRGRKMDVANYSNADAWEKCGRNLFLTHVTKFSKKISLLYFSLRIKKNALSLHNPILFPKFYQFSNFKIFKHQFYFSKN